MNKKDLFQLIASLLNVEADEVTIDTSPDDFSNWDSFKHMELLLAIEDKYSIKLTDIQIAKIKNVQDIHDTLIDIGV